MSVPTADLSAPPAIRLAPGLQAGPVPGRPSYEIDGTDAVFALVTLVVGYLWWDWLVPRSQYVPLPEVTGPGGGSGGALYQDWLPGLGVTAFFALALAASLVYYRLRSAPVTRGTWLGAGAILLATGPFALYATTPPHLLLGLVLVVAFVAWHATVAGGGGAGRTWVTDALNEGLTPLRNLGAWWAGLIGLLRGHRRPAQAIAALVGLLVGLPVLVLVVWLLMAADPTFSTLIDRLVRAFGHLSLGRAFWQAVGAVPVAIWAMALLYGNARRRGTDTLTPAALERFRRLWQRLPQAGLTVPVGTLCLIYLVFFAGLASYLFSAFAGRLPADYTYASFARRGFFELAAVAVINAAVLAFAQVFASRAGGVYPRALRWLGILLAAQTLLLIATSVSKMVLYTSRFGLTQLRLWVLAFLAVLFVAFALVLVRHLVRFDAARPIAAMALVVLVGLAWANPNGLIARSNVERYQSGGLAQIDVAYLADYLGDAAVPALLDLRDDADPAVAAAARQAIADKAATAQAITDAGGGPWTAWSWQGQHASALLRSAG